jgi:WD40 repeat protein
VRTMAGRCGCGMPIPANPSVAAHGHTVAVLSVAFSPDAPRLATASYDKTVRIWPAIATPEMLCDKLTANMSHKKWREWISADIEYVELCPGLPIPGD